MTLSSEVFLCSLGAAIRALIGSLEWDRWAKYVFDSVTITSLFSQRGVGGVGTATAARKAGDRKVDNDHAEHHHQQQQQKKKRMMQKGKVSELDDKKSRYCEVDKEVDVDGDGAVSYTHLTLPTIE